MSAYQQPILTRLSLPIEIPMSVSALLGYLSNYDSNLSISKLPETLKLAQRMNDGLRGDQVELLKRPGAGLRMAGVSAESLITEGENSVKRRGFYQIAGEPISVEGADLKGKKIKWIKAATLVNPIGEVKSFANEMNVSPLLNELGFGFDLSSGKPKFINPFVNDRLAYLKSLKSKVFYVSQQMWQREPDDQFDLKHTVWLILPKSMDDYNQISNLHVQSGEYIRFARFVEHQGRF